MICRDIYFPYCLRRNDKNGTYIILNRDYKPIGFNINSDKYINYDEYPVATKIKIAKNIPAKLSYRVDDDPNMIYLYNDGCVPTQSKEHMNSYLKKLSILLKLRISLPGNKNFNFEEKTDSRKFQVLYVYFPYTIERERKKGVYTILNRLYEPVGFNVRYGTGIAPKKYPVAVKINITEQRAGELSFNNNNNINMIYLYNDGCVPTQSKEHMNSYLKKLSILAKFKIKKEML